MICQHFGECGGCASQDLDYARQLADKRAALRDILRPFLPSSPDRDPFPVMIGMRGIWGFRRKVAFAFGPGPSGRGLVMGHYARGSRHLVPVNECPVHSARGNRIAFALRDELARARVPAATSRGGLLRHVLVRTTADDREAVALLVVTRNDRSLRAPIRALLESPDRPDGFLLNFHDGPGPFMVGSKTLKIAGREHVRERVNGWSFLVSPTAFFQTNTEAAGALQSLVTAGVGGATRVLELYAGSGLFTVPLASAGAHVLAIEENRQAVQDAKRNLALNRVPPGRVRLVCARVEEALQQGEATRQAWDAIVLDPPRQGCSPVVLSSVFGAYRAPRVVYVSCNPDALAGELETIAAADYRIERCHAVDMFPHTDHIETVIELIRSA